LAYLGNRPAESFASFEKQVFTIVNSQTAYTLSHSVTNENDIRLVVNNVVQEPGSGKAYTASGTTLTLSAALTNGTDTMYCVFLGRALQTVNPPNASVGSAQIADSSVSLAKLTATGTKDATTFLRGDNSFQAVPSGLGMADQWRVTQDMTNSDLSSGVVHQYLERCDSTGYSVLGTGMTESSGIFTFPSTGYYLITFSSTHSGPRDDGFITSRIDVTTDNSSYTTVSEATDNNGAGSGTNAGAFMQTQFLFDVTDTSTHKCRFQYTSLNSGTIINGSSTINKTNMFFMKLGDT
jgi:hypothetical protein